MEHSFDKDYWDQIWQGERAAAMGTSPTNPHLIKEIGDLQPGTALDAGCGAGAEAIWLAQQGWQVTAVDVAAEALAFVAARAADRGVADRVQWVQADLSVWEPATRYDLVTTHYAHPAIPQLEFYDRIASWVAPAGTETSAEKVRGPSGRTRRSGRGHQQACTDRPFCLPQHA